MTISNAPAAERQRLDEDECLVLLGHESEGRLALTAGAPRVIVPIHFTATGRTVTFTTELGIEFVFPCDAPVACLEVEWFDTSGYEGWRVLAVGRLQPQADHVELPIELISGCRVMRVES
jgi:hypothetical protein